MARKAQSSANASNPVGTENTFVLYFLQMDLGHVVVALKGDRIAKVQCKTCKRGAWLSRSKGHHRATEKAAKKERKRTTAIPPCMWKSNGSAYHVPKQGTSDEALWRKKGLYSRATRSATIRLETGSSIA